MHEIAISETICKTIEREAKLNGIPAVRTAKLRIGRMAAFDRANLELCLKGQKENPILCATAFEIEEVPVKLKCKGCRKTFVDERFDDFDFAHKVAHAPAFYMPPPCPSCKTKEATIVAGQEMELVSIAGE